MKTQMRVGNPTISINNQTKMTCKKAYLICNTIEQLTLKVALCGFAPLVFNLPRWFKMGSGTIAALCLFVYFVTEVFEKKVVLKAVFSDNITIKGENEYDNRI